MYERSLAFTLTRCARPHRADQQNTDHILLLFTPLLLIMNFSCALTLSRQTAFCVAIPLGDRPFTSETAILASVRQSASSERGASAGTLRARYKAAIAVILGNLTSWRPACAAHDVFLKPARTTIKIPPETKSTYATAC